MKNGHGECPAERGLNGRERVERVLVLCPADGDASAEVLSEAGILAVVCADLPDLCRQLDSGAGAVLLEEESLSDPRSASLFRTLERQPGWSELPVMVLSSHGSEEDHPRLAPIPGLVLLDRHPGTPVLVSALQAALRARRLQYRIRDQESDQARTEAERARLLSCIGETEEAVFTHTPDGAIESWNRGAERLFGYQEREVLGRSVSLLAPEDRREELRKLQEATFRGEAVRDLETEQLRKDGRRVPVRITVCPSHDEHGRLARLTWVSHDLTAHDLEQAEFRRLIGELEDADRRKENFLAVLAHELRNPLATILFGLEALRIFPPDHPSFLDARDIMERKIHYMSRLLEDLLEVSRLTRDKIELVKRRVDVANVLAEGVQAVQDQVRQRGQEITLYIEPGSLWADADPARLDQIFSNLLSNAMKYTGRGGHIAVRAGRLGREVEVRVKDTGIGIPRELLPQVFDLFIQGDQSLDRSQGGLGIGLTLVRRLVELHGGTVQAFSEGRGKGSEFVVRLPAREREEKDRDRDREAPTPFSASWRILVVEDSMDTANLLAEILKGWGHQVVVAYDGPQALQEARDSAPDLAILDIGLPGMDGYEVARRLKASAAHRRTVLVAMTGYGQEEDRQRSREAGIDYHLVKPVEVKALQSLLRSLQAQAAIRG